MHTTEIPRKLSAANHCFNKAFQPKSNYALLKDAVARPTKMDTPSLPDDSMTGDLHRFTFLILISPFTTT